MAFGPHTSGPVVSVAEQFAVVLVVASVQDHVKLEAPVVTALAVPVAHKDAPLGAAEKLPPFAVPQAAGAEHVVEETCHAPHPPPGH